MRREKFRASQKGRFALGAILIFPYLHAADASPVSTATAAEETQKKAAISKAHAKQALAPTERKQQAGAAHAVADQLEQVSVTARRREEKEQDVPVSMHVITGRLMARDNNDTLQSLQYLAPSMTINQFNPRQTAVGIRGIGFNTANDGFDPSVGIFLDGVYLGRPGEIGFDLPDIESVEVLRGPQGTLFGRNTSAGALIINTRKPSWTPQANAEVDVGNYGFHEFKASASGPLIKDKLAVRVSAYDDLRDGVQRNSVTGGNANTRNEQGIRAQALFTPTDTLTARIIYGYQQQNFIPPIYQIYGATPVAAGKLSLAQRIALYPSLAGYAPPTNLYARRTDYNGTFLAKGHQNSVSGQLDWRLPGGFTLTSITSWLDWYFYPTNDGDYSGLDYDQFGAWNRAKQYSEELKLSTPSNRKVVGTAGLYYYHQRVQANAYTNYRSQGGILNTLATARNIHALDTILNGYNTMTIADPTTDSLAAYGQATWHIHPKVEITGGLRYTYEYKREHLLQYGWGGLSSSELLDSGDPAITSALIASARAGGAALDQNYSLYNSNVSGAASIVYHVLDNVMFYANYARGFKSGALNTTVVPAGFSAKVNPELTDNVEIGFKSALLRNHLLLNADVFDEYVQGYQANTYEQVNGVSRSVLTNAGAARSEGFEVDTTLLPFQGLRIDAALSYNDAKFASYRNAPCSNDQVAAGQAVCDMTGRRLSQAPRWIFNFNAEYERALTETLSGYVVGQWNLRSGSYLSADDFSRSWQPGYGLLNLRIGLRWKYLDGSFYVDNATGQNYMQTVQDSAGSPIMLAIPNNPRFYGVRLSARY